MKREPQGEVKLPPKAVPIPDADRRRLEELLRELLRDETIRRLFCGDVELASEPKSPEQRLKVVLRLVARD